MERLFKIVKINKGFSNRYAINRLVLVFFLMLLFSAYQAAGQIRRDVQQAKDQISQFPEIYMSIPTGVMTYELASLASLDYFYKGRAYLYVNREALDHILDNEISFRLEKSPGVVNFDLNMLKSGPAIEKALTDTWDFYPTYEAYVDLMYHFEKIYPDLVEIHNIGKTIQGRDILFARISPQLKTDRTVPQFMYTSTMHGDETAGFILSLRLIWHLITNYDVDDQITQLMNGLEIWICPNENPDGTYTNNNATVNGATRSNSAGIDLNRNYPTPHPNPPTPPVTPIQPETQAMMDFVARHNFIMSANMHGGVELVNFPYDAWRSSEQKHADHTWWELVMNEYVDTVHAYSPQGYMTDISNGVTHGGDWYVVYGSRQDYMNYFHSCREFTLELSRVKLLPPDLLPQHWEYNHRSLINYMMQAKYGIHGVITDAGSGSPVNATIELVDHDMLNSHVSTSTATGNFARPVYSGTYDVKFSAEGYPGAVLPGVPVNNYERIDLTIVLADEVFPVYVTSGNPSSSGMVFGSGLYPQDYPVVLSANPSSNYIFSYWEDLLGNVVSEDPVLEFLMPDTTVRYIAVFDELPAEFLVIFGVGVGQGDLNARVDERWITSGFSVRTGSDVVFHAEPAKGYKTESWKVNDRLVEDYSELEFREGNLRRTLDVVVNFHPEYFDFLVIVANPNAGQVSVLPDQERYTYGQSVVLSASPTPGFVFHSWVNSAGDVLSSDTLYTFSMPANDLEITAVFSIIGIADKDDFGGDVKVFPNPSRGSFLVESDFDILGVELSENSGRMLMVNHNLEVRRKIYTIENIPAGYYILRILGSGIVVTKKVQVL